MAREMIKLNEEETKTLKNMGALGYKPEKICSIMELDFNEFQEEFKNKNSQIFKHYQSGKDYAEYIIDYKIFELAESGDLKAIQLHKERLIMSKFN